MTVFYWNIFFVALNALQLFFILRERYGGKNVSDREHADVAVDVP